VNYLSVESISKSYGAKKLFDKISFGLNQGQRIALIAKNGAGKSTLLKIITGKEIPDEGNVTFRKDITVTYLNQNPTFDENETVVEAIYNTSNPSLYFFRVQAIYRRFIIHQNCHVDHSGLQCFEYNTELRHDLRALGLS